MCGISGFWAKESLCDISEIELLLKYGEMRGSDAVGVVVVGIGDSGQMEVIDELKLVGTGDRQVISQWICDHVVVGDLVLINHRATPETEQPSTDNRSIQPIIDVNNGVVLVHNGAVSNKIYDELKPNDGSAVSCIDSEAIIWSYIQNGRNMKSSMEQLSGGFGFLMVDMKKEQLYCVCSHTPLYSAYVRGYGMYCSSLKQCMFDIISDIKGTNITKNNICVWEDYYVQEMPSNTIVRFDLDSGMRSEQSFIPRYIHPQYDPYSTMHNGNCVLVCASGGLDSTTTMAVLKSAGYDVRAVHFIYGHRGGDCELAAISEIAKILDVPLYVFDISDNMKQLDSASMLMNDEHEITTGTVEGVKTTIAWTCFRNGFFLTYMGALAESLIISEKYESVYYTGGFLNLTESGTYPDNSERFVNAFDKFSSFASIVGDRINPIYACANLLKTEQYIILDKLNYLEVLSPWMVSCDRPKLIDGKPHNCIGKDGIPKCGSGKLSYWATKAARVKDGRRYYVVEDDNYDDYVVDSNRSNVPTIELILSKLQIHAANLKVLRDKID